MAERWKWKASCRGEPALSLPCRPSSSWLRLRRHRHCPCPSRYTETAMANLEIQIREKEGITILDLKGRLAVGEACTLLREKVDQKLTDRQDRIILNLK